MRHIALEGRCYVLSCCQYLTRADCPEDYDAIQGNDPSTILMRGGSCIIGPLGQILAGPNFDGPCMLNAELDLSEVSKSKYDFDVVGHYARPDIFRLYVNTQAMKPVVVSSNGLVDPFSEGNREGGDKENRGRSLLR
jgi:nitrilase